MRIRTSAVRLAMALGIALSLSGCSIFPDQEIPAGLIPVSGGTQEVAPNAQAAKALTVRVVDQDTEPLEDVTVEWVIKSGNGTLSAAETKTGDNGETSVTFTAGATTGTTYVLARVPVVGTAVSFAITVK